MAPAGLPARTAMPAPSPPMSPRAKSPPSSPPVRLVSGLQRDFEILQEMPREAFRLHVGEVQAEAHMRAAAIRHPGEAVAIALRLVGEAKRVEFFRLRPDISHVVGEQRVDTHH